MRMTKKKNEKREPQIPARVPSLLINQVNAVRAKDGYAWKGLMERLFTLYIKSGKTLFEK